MEFLYPLCDRTVTVYRRENDIVSRRVARGCFYRWEDVAKEDSAGVGFTRKFLLIQPGQGKLCPGDRIFDGEGPAVADLRWEDFIPEKVAGLSVAAYAAPWYWENKLCHTEAGRK